MKIFSKGHKDNSYSVHYYRAHVGDFGEPAGNKQKPSDQCEWTNAGGVSIAQCSLHGEEDIDTLTCSENADCGNHGSCDLGSCVADPPFAAKGGEICDECPDFYEIEIYCGSTYETRGDLLYRVGNFISEGNFQIHPEVSQHCEEVQ